MTQTNTAVDWMWCYEHPREAAEEIERLRKSPDKAVPVDQWEIVMDEQVLIYVVHPNAQFEQDEAVRKRDWESWFTGRWIEHNGGGWTWHGMSGTVTHVAPLPPAPGTSG